MTLLIQIIKTLLVPIYVIGTLFSSTPAGGDLFGSEPADPGDPSQYLQISANDEGIDTWQPVEGHGGYRYGPSMILNADGSVDLWSAANGPGDIIDVVTYKRLYDGCRQSTAEVIALKPTAESYDGRWTCDPGVVRFGGYYYIGYTTTLNPAGIQNEVCIGRSKNPDGPYEKWDGTGWGGLPEPIVKYTGNPACFGVGEPSFVVLGDTLFVYYSWCDERGATTRVATADATDENWPATLVERGECIPPKAGGGDSADVKYVDEYGRFVAVFTEYRFTDYSCVAVWESFDGIEFRPSGFVKANTAKKLHNCGISGRADGHICAGDPVYLSYAYGGAGDGEWGNWATRLHEVSLSLADAPKLDSLTEENAEITVTRQPVSLLPKILTVKAEKQVYTLAVNGSAQVIPMAYDADGMVFPLLAGVTFADYDPAVIRIVGGRIYPVAPGDTRATLSWRGFTGDFVVHVTEKAE